MKRVINLDIFCKIANNEIPSYTLYEDDIVKIFLDVNPDVNGHTLIIPKKHFKDLFDIDEKTLIHIINKAKEIEKLLKEKLNIDGLTLVQNNGCVQEVKHFHLHLKPSYKNKEKLLSVEEIYNILKK
ncbi:MAG: HIT domain-containing protein [Bacilli bacterium]|nr:HIT domain-containing protein [Bacilli bacterium]